jgi:hypothetical protein
MMAMRIPVRNVIRIPIILGFLIVFAGFVWVKPARGEDYAVARTGALEGTVSLQAARGSAYEDMTVNMPVEPGDRVRSGDDGRAGFEMSDGSIVRIGFDTKIDFLAVPQFNSETPSTPAFRLWSGEAYFETPGAEAGGRPMEVDTPTGAIRLTEPGVYRVDLDTDGNTRVSVFSGSAEVESPSGMATVSAGERTYVYSDQGPENPVAFDMNDEDDFARWNDRQDSLYASAGGAVEEPSDIPSDVQPYYPELSRYGTWVYDDEYNCEVWRPDVTADWRPYWDGYWNEEPWGPCWVSYEPWGWAPYHFGRWSFSASLGWCWIPGSVWAPAWVDWWVGPGYLGWSPLNYYGFPVSTFGFSFGFGHEGFRGRGHGFDHHRFSINPRTWTVVGEHDIFSRHLRDHALPARVVSSLEPGVLESRAPRLSRRDPAGSLRQAYNAGLNGRGFLAGTERHPAPEQGTMASFQPAAPLRQAQQRTSGSRGATASRGRVSPAAGSSSFGRTGFGNESRRLSRGTAAPGRERLFSSTNNTFRSIERGTPGFARAGRSFETIRPQGRIFSGSGNSRQRFGGSSFRAPGAAYSGRYAVRQPTFNGAPHVGYSSAPRYAAPHFSSPGYGGFRGGFRSMPSGNGFHGFQGAYRSMPSGGGFRGGFHSMPSGGGFRGGFRSMPSGGGFHGFHASRGGFGGRGRR